MTEDSEPKAREPKKHIPKPEKDNWDKVGAIAPIVSGALMFALGGFFTYTYNQQQLRLQEAQTIEKFIPHLLGNEQSKKAAVLAISSLTNAELAGKIASIFASQGTVSALQSIADNGNTHDKAVASDAIAKALENIAERESKLDDIETAYRKAIDRTQGEATLADKLDALAEMYKSRNKLDLAESLYKRSLALRRSLYGAESAQTIKVEHNLAEVEKLEGKEQPAEPESVSAKELPVEVESPVHETTEKKSASPAEAEKQAGSNVEGGQSTN